MNRLKPIDGNYEFESIIRYTCDCIWEFTVYRYRLIFFCSFFLSTRSNAQEDSPPQFGLHGASTHSEKVVVVNWNSPEGRIRSSRSAHNNDFYQLAHFFSPQIYPTFCGIASSTIVLNAMRVPHGRVPANPKLEMNLPKIWGGRTVPYHIYTQETFFNEATERVKTRALISLKNITAENEDDETAFSPGLALSELGGMMTAHGANVEVIYADNPHGIDLFRQHLKIHLADSTHFVIANFHGKGLGLNSGGHISPLAAFDADSDSVLILDVASTKRPWVWIPVEDFFRAMYTLDGEKSRGYIVVSEAKEN